ncbi:MAG TPA: hypothetical protein VGK24_06590 [Candidatus Angelobacter sp.]
MSAVKGSANGSTKKCSVPGYGFTSIMRRSWGIIVVCSLLGIVGCGSVGSGGANNTLLSSGPTPSPTPSASPTPSPSPSPTPPAPTPTPSPAALIVSPGAANVALGSSQTFTATGSGLPVTWSVNGIPGGNSIIGTITASGVYVPPAVFPATNGFAIKAISQANSAVSATASLLVVYPNDTAGVQTLPIKLGTTGGNGQDVSPNACCIGTLGSLWNFNGGQFILSNSHVLARSGQGLAGEAVNQPGAAACFASPNTVANLSLQSALLPTPTSNGIAESNVDAALAQIVAGTVDASGNILDLGVPGPTSIAAAPPSSTLEAPALGLPVAKSGRTTGLTCSTIGSINGTISVDFASFCGGPTLFTSKFVGQVVISDSGFSAAGDSGSLIVTTVNARPVAMVFAGDGTNTIANPIQDVIDEFSSHARPPIVLNIVGGGDHPVSCQPTASVSPATQVGPLSAVVHALSSQERLRVENARQVNAAMLMHDPAIASVELGASEDSPREGSLVVHVTGALKAPIPVLIDGVRTKVVFDAKGSQGQQISIAQLDVDRATAVKEAHVADLMSQAGIQGVGVAISKDNPAETALAIYIVRGMPRSSIPATIDGIRTQLIEGDRFRAY